MAMTTFSWDITERVPLKLGRAPGSSGIYSVDTEQFDIAISDIPFLLYTDKEDPYERRTAQWQKDQFDADRNVGEQSLTGWWLRSQSSFRGGSGVTYYEPLMGDESDQRFRDSRGVDVFSEAGEVSLLHETAREVEATAEDLELVSSPARVLIRNGGLLIAWDGTDEDAVTGTTSANGLTYTGSLFLIGDDDGIQALDATTGTTLTPVWTDAPAPVRPYWVKQRIFATSGRNIYELTLAGGDLSLETPLFTHPDPNWVWTSVSETGGAVWAAGYSGSRSAVHVIAIGDDGSTPDLTGATVGIQLPDGELANAIYGYLDFLIVGSTRGLRVAITDGDRAQLGPIVFEDNVLSLTARGDYVWGGLADGLTRKVDLGTLVSGNLGFAWANDLESSGAGEVRSLAWFGSKLCLAESGTGLWVEQDALVPSGFLTTGYARFGTVEPKHIQSIFVTADASAGSIGVSAGADDPLQPHVTLANFKGSRNVAIHVPGGTAVRFSLMFTFNRSEGDPTKGPVFRSYQVRALPAPTKRQRMIRFPLMCFDWQKNRFGVQVGGEHFASVRIRELEKLEDAGTPVLMQDFRTGEARIVVIDQVHFRGPDSPDGSEHNFGGVISVVVRTVD